MPLHLSDSDVRALAAAMRVLVAPGSCGDLTEWQRASGEAVLRLVGADGASFMLPHAGGDAIVGAGHWSGETFQRALADYSELYHHRSSIEARRLASGKRSWVRRELVSRRAFERTEYYQEWCRPTSCLDSAGISAPLPWPADAEAVFHLTSVHVGRFEPEGREQLLLRLLQPAFEAGARAAVLAVRWLMEFASGLDQLDGAVVLAAADGRIVHANPAASRLLGAEGSCELTAAVATSAASLDRLCAGTRGAGSADPATLPSALRRCLQIAGAAYVIRSVVLDAGAGGMPRLILVTIDPPTGPGMLPAPGLQAMFGLTPREAEVAGLLGEGHRNHEIAARLSVTEHTARRHTERVLRKLGVRSRSAVAAAIRHRAAAPDAVKAS
jgi:DNA-binding CsgD family transcriptional regulator/PAS domain-containing protein